MIDSTPNPAAPGKVLLATDLSARGDRALERAVAIAQRHGSHLFIVHVVEQFDESKLAYDAAPAPSWRRPADAVAVIKNRIRQALHADLGDAVDLATVLIEEGDPAAVVERIATSERVDLVITGVAREGLFAGRPVIVGRTVEKLLRRLPAPILIVRNRARTPYQHVAVTTDFSATSAHALQLAARFFPDQLLHVVHASEAPYSTLVKDVHQHAENYARVHAAEFATFLDSVFLPEVDRRRLVTFIEPGAPAQLIREYVDVHGADLVVLGTRGRGAVLETLLGSTAKSILATLPCDALVVRGPPR